MSDRPDWNVEGRDWPNRAHSRFVRVGGMPWHVQVMGAGPVLLLLHGTGAATHSWRALLPRLAERFTVVAPDLPGHGFSGSGAKTLPAMAQAIAALLGDLELKPAVVVGHSAGAAIGVRMVLDRCVGAKAVIGLSPALLPFPGLAAKLFPTMARLLFVNPFAPHIFAGIARGPGEVARFMLRSTGSTIDAAGIDSYARLFGKPAHIAGTIAMMASWDLEPLRRELPRFALPLLLIHGDRDSAIPLTTARAAAALVPGARLDVLHGLGHLAHEETPDAVAAMITAFASAQGSA